MNSTCDNCHEYTFGFINVFFLIVYGVLIVFICGGNLLTIVAIWKTPVLRTVSNVYVALLAFADCIAGLSLPFQMVAEVPEGRQLLDNNKQLCLWRNVTFFVATSLSIFSIIVIAFDRAIYIGRPFLYIRIATYRQAFVVTCICLVLSIIFGTVCLYSNRWQPGGQCTALSVLTLEYQLYGQSIPIIICFIMAGTCYGYIFYIAKKHQKQICSSQNRTVVANDMKIIKVLFLVYGIFLLCWLPLVITLIVMHVTHTPSVALDITLPLAVLNSGMNFIVYAVKNKDYRKAFKDILRDICIRKKSNTVTPLKSVASRCDVPLATLQH